MTLTPFMSRPIAVTHNEVFVCDDGNLVTFTLPRAMLYEGKDTGFNEDSQFVNGVISAEPLVRDVTPAILGNAASTISVVAAESNRVPDEFGAASSPVWHVIDDAGALHRATQDGVTLVDSGPWASVTSSGSAWAALRTDGTLYTWGDDPIMLGDGSGSTRATPTAICDGHKWVFVTGYGTVNGSIFYAIRKDAVCREPDQAMEYWPSWFFEQ